MSKTGILTLSAATNYGAVLQAYSLCEFINMNYGEAEVIDYVPGFVARQKQRRVIFFAQSRSGREAIKNLAISIGACPFLLVKEVKFRRFKRQYIHLSKKQYRGFYEEDMYDRYIVGSDQVFNLQITENDLVFFLPHIDGHKKVTYAASLGKNSITEAEEVIFEKYLPDFEYISIREENGCRIIGDILGKKVVQNIDPVFLNGRFFWDGIALDRMIKEDYVLIYSFKNFEKAYNVANNEGIRIVRISNSIRKRKGKIVNYRTTGPQEFLSLIKFASLVVTDSFHGMAFSILFERDFVAIPFEGTESRMMDLLKKLDLEDRIYCNGDFARNEIDYDHVRCIVEGERKLAFDYLDKVFNR